VGSLPFAEEVSLRPLSVRSRRSHLICCTLGPLLCGAPAARAQEAPPEPPAVLESPQPSYPGEALALGTRGDVAVNVDVDAAGNISGVSMVRGVAPALDRAAMEAAARWRFQAARRAGLAVPSRVQLLFHFEPPAAPSPLAPLPRPAPVAPPPAALPSASALAAGSAPEPAPAPAALDVSVLGRRPPPSRGASDFQIRVDQLGEVPRANAAELLKLAPGILLTNEGGEGHAEQVFMRGFDAREGQDIEFTVGGVPINESGNLHGNGYADTHFIIPELVESLRVLEGPFDPRQGNFAVAGSADYELGLAQRGLTARVTSGSFGSQRVLGLWGPPGESTHTFGGAEIARGDGFGQNRDAERGSVMGQYEGRVGGAGSYRLTAQGYATHFHSAGIVREDDYQAGRLGFYDSYDLLGSTRQQVPEGGDASRFSLAGDVDARAGDMTFALQAFVIKRDMRLLENFTGFLLDVQEPLQTLHPQRGDMLDLDVHELTIGTRGAARLHGSWFGQRQELELGAFARGDAAAGTQQRLEAATGVPYRTESDLDSQIGDIAVYTDVNLRPRWWLSLRGGARAELLTYSVLDNCAAQSIAHPSTTDPPIDQSCLSQQDKGRPREPDQRTATSSVAFLPRVSAIVGPLRGLSLSASYGQGMRSIDPGYITQDIKTPFASVAATEAGAAYAARVRGATVVARSVLFRTVVDKDLIFSETAGRNVLGVGTTRTGWVGALRLTGSFFDEAANLTLVRATYNDNGTAVAYVPGTVFRSDTALFGVLPWRLAGVPVRASLSGGITYVGPRPLPYGEVSGSIFTVDAAATLAWSHYEVRLASTNLLGAQYRLGEYDFASDFRSQPQPTLVPEREFTAGAPRAVFVTLGINLGGRS
jgi:iron complex outermembrane recepter protein